MYAKSMGPLTKFGHTLNTVSSMRLAIFTITRRALLTVIGQVVLPDHVLQGCTAHKGPHILSENN